MRERHPILVCARRRCPVLPFDELSLGAYCGLTLATNRLSPARLVAGAATVDGWPSRNQGLVKVSIIGLLVAAVAQAVAIVAVATSGKKNTTALEQLLDNVWFVVGLAALLLSLAVRYLARVWVSEANEAFRYTCSLGSFDPVTDTDGKMLPDLCERLRHDVGRRLSERITRLTFLDEQVADAQFEPGRVPHLHVCGRFLIVEDRQGIDTLEVVPRVRIGSIESGESLAVPAEIKLETSVRWVGVGGIPLDPDIYERIVERVYFSLATEIYRQIRADVERKIALLPTRRLRATAYLVEAEDYARSNTLRAYEAAGELFLRAMTLYDPRWAPLASRGARRAGQRLVRANAAVHAWVAGTLAKSLHRPARRLVRVSRAELGYAKMMLARRLFAGMSGYRLNPIFLARPVAERAAARLDGLVEDAEGVQETRFDAHVVLAGAWRALRWNAKAQSELEEARGLEPLAAHEHAGYVLARGVTEPRLRSALPFLRRAVELDPRSEVAQFQLAWQTELFWRTRPALERSVAEHTIEEYRRVLGINPSNVRAWANIGSMYWLLEPADTEGDERAPDTTRAREAYERARRLKETVTDIYVADVDFGLARIAAEGMDVEAAYHHYIHGMAAMVSEGVAQASHEGEIFELISPAMVDRFRRYHANVFKGLDDVEKHGASSHSRRLRQSIRAFVSHDLGTALYSLWRRTGEDRLADEAAHHYKEARKANADFVLPYFYNAYLDLQRDSPADAERWRGRIEALEPQWRAGKVIACVIDAVRARDFELKAADLDENLAAIQTFGARLSTPIPTVPGPELEVETATQLAGDQDLRPEHRARIEEVAGKYRRLGRDLRDRASQRIVELFPQRSGERWPWRPDGDFDWQLLEDPTIRRRDERELRWERGLDDFLLHALSMWILGRASALSPDTGEAARLLALVRHVGTRFHAHPRLLSLEALLTVACGDVEGQRKVAEAERDHHLEALNRDPVSVDDLRWLVREASDELLEADATTAVERRREFLDHAAAKAEMSESRHLVAEGFWAIGAYGHALDSLRSAALFERDDVHKARLSAEYRLRAAVYRDSIGAYPEAVNELGDLAQERPPDGAEGWRAPIVTAIVESDVAQVDPLNPARNRRSQRTLSLWLDAEQRRVASQRRDGGRIDLAAAQAAAARTTVFGGMALPLTSDDGDTERLIPLVSPIRLACEEALFPGAEEGAEAARMLDVELPRVQQAVRHRTGVAVPGVNLGLEPGLGVREFRVLLEETPVLHEAAPRHDPYDYMASRLEDVLLREAWRFFGVDEAGKVLAQLEPKDSGSERARRLARRERAATLILMSGVVQALLRDAIRVDLDAVLDVVAARSPHDSVGVLTERSRFALRRHIPGSADPGRLVRLSDEFERALSERVTRFRGVGALAVTDGELEALLAILRGHLGDHKEGTTVAVHMPGLRPHVQELVRIGWPETRVLAEDELLDQWWSPDDTVEFDGRVTGHAG